MNNRQAVAEASAAILDIMRGAQTEAVAAVALDAFARVVESTAFVVAPPLVAPDPLGDPRDGFGAAAADANPAGV